MSTEDEREKRREGSPEWHRARANSLREHGFTKMAEEHEQIAREIEQRREQHGRNSAILKGEIAHLERIIARGQKCLGVSKGRSGRRLRQRNGHDLLPCFWTDHCWKIPV